MGSENLHSKTYHVISIAFQLLFREDVGSGHLVDTISLEVEQLLHEVHSVADMLWCFINIM